MMDLQPGNALGGLGYCAEDGSSGSTLPDELWLYIIPFVLSDSFSTCTPMLVTDKDGRMTTCDHSVGFCTESSLLAESKARITALASVDRRIRRLFRPFLFRVLVFSYGKEMSEWEMLMYHDRVPIGNAARSRNRIEFINARPDLCAHVRAVLIQGVEAPSTLRAFIGMAKEFPGLRSFYVSGGTPYPASGDNFSALFKSFLINHPTIEKFGIYKEVDGGWIGEFADDVTILPNLVAFAGGIGTAAALALQRPSLKTFDIMLPSTHRIVTLRDLFPEMHFFHPSNRPPHRPTYADLASATADRLINLRVWVGSLNIEDGHDESPFVQYLHALPENTETLFLQLEAGGSFHLCESTGAAKRVSSHPHRISALHTLLTHEMWQTLQNSIVLALGRLEQLRTVEAVLLSRPLDREMQALARAFQVNIAVASIPHPHIDNLDPKVSDHPMRNSLDRRVRGHPSLERVKILSSGTWVWSATVGWGYCI